MNMEVSTRDFYKSIRPSWKTLGLRPSSLRRRKYPRGRKRSITTLNKPWVLVSVVSGQIICKVFKNDTLEFVYQDNWNGTENFIGFAPLKVFAGLLSPFRHKGFTLKDVNTSIQQLGVPAEKLVSTWKIVENKGGLKSTFTFFNPPQSLKEKLIWT